MASHLNPVLQTKATDIIVVYNQYSQYDYIRKHVKGFDAPGVLNIYPKKNWKLSRFENNPKILKRAVRQIGKKVKTLFGLKSGITLFESKNYAN